MLLTDTWEFNLQEKEGDRDKGLVNVYQVKKSSRANNSGQDTKQPVRTAPQFWIYLNNNNDKNNVEEKRL